MNANIKIKLLFDMLRIRMVEETIAKLYHELQMRCPVHLCIGQEATAVGVCANLSKGDYVLSNHRSHGHYLAKGGNLKAMLAEIYGKVTGCSKGKGGSMHLVDLEVNFLGSTPIVGGVIPVAVGVAFGTVMKEENRITVVFLGDAAIEEGAFCESLNFASLKKLPVIFVCENNFFSVYSPLNVRQPKERDNLALARSYGISATEGDGNDVLSVFHLSGLAVNHVREGKGPYYIQFDTYRWREHCGPNFDNYLGYRTEEAFIEWKKRCPIENFEKKLIEALHLDEKMAAGIKNKIMDEIEDAVSFAKSSPFPEAEQLYLNVYA